MIQNGANVSAALFVTAGGRTRRRRRLPFGSVLLGLCALGAAAAEGPPRLRLHDEARALLERAGRVDVSPEEALRALADAAGRLTTLGAEPEAGTAPPGASLTPEMRLELRRAGADLAAVVRSGPAGRVDTAPYLALLERVRAQLQGEIALGLTLQGSYSQTQARDPAYGGHASAMGPAPAQVPAARDVPDGTVAPVSFEEGAQLPTRTHGGGPTKDHILESAGNGIALFDYDGDGRLDVYLVTAAELTPGRQRVPHRNALYRNLGQWRFEDVSKRAGVDAAGWGSGACAGDFDGDARLDLYVTNWGPNLLFRNQGDGTFAEVAAPAGVQAGGWSTGCSFFDADADGDLDLYVARYVATTWDDLARARRTLTWRNGPRIMVGPTGLPGESDLYFENRGGGRFAEGAEAHGLGDPAKGYGFGVVTTDYDDDGFVDLFVANDSTPNFLYRNRGDGHFESVGLVSGVAVNGEARAQAGMGADAGDYDGDGRMDLVLTAFARDTNTLYRNLDGRQFTDESAASGLVARTYERMGWGVAFLDADLDGRLDLFFANGHIFADIDDHPQLQETYRQKNQLLLNAGAGFRDVSESAGKGLQIARVGRGLAVGDLDDDGDLDLVVSNMDEAPTLLENRQATGHHWIAFRLVAAGANPFAIGARVTLTAGGGRQVREVRSGGSYLSQSDLRAHFGLGGHAGPVDVDVRMPGGRRYQWRGLAADRVHVLELPR
jgi:enediyne biosynthesis protein E4